MALIIGTSGDAVDLQDFKKFMNRTDSADDAELQSTLDRAVRVLRKRFENAGMKLTSEVITGEKHNGGGDTVVLKWQPVTAVTAVTYWDGPAVDVDDLEVDTGAGLVTWGYGTAGSFLAGTRNVRVTYSAGFAELPEDLVQAVFELARHLWQSQRGGGQRPAYPGNIPPAEVDESAPAFLLPYRVQSLIDPYLSAPTVA